MFIAMLINVFADVEERREESLALRPVLCKHHASTKLGTKAYANSGPYII